MYLSHQDSICRGVCHIYIDTTETFTTRRGGNVTEFDSIYGQHFQDVYSFVLSLSLNEKIAEEITQEKQRRW